MRRCNTPLETPPATRNVIHYSDRANSAPAHRVLHGNNKSVPLRRCYKERNNFRSQ